MNQHVWAFPNRCVRAAPVYPQDLINYQVPRGSVILTQLFYCGFQKFTKILNFAIGSWCIGTSKVMVNSKFIADIGQGII